MNNHVHTYTNAGTVIEGPSNVTYLPDETPLPIELTCNVTGVAAWRVNGTIYILADLTDGALPGHSRNGTNILVNSPVNNTEYICLSATNDGVTISDPAYIIIAGECVHVNGTKHLPYDHIACTCNDIHAYPYNNTCIYRYCTCI